MTDIFIASVFLLIVIYDIFLAIRKQRTITSYFRVWYTRLFIIPYAVGVVFLGHFIDAFDSSMGTLQCALSLASISAIVLFFSVIQYIKEYEFKKKIYVLIPLAFGYLIGDLFW